MTRYEVCKDGTERVASTATRELALDLVRAYQEEERKKHSWLWSEFSIITVTNEEFIPYKK